MVFVVAAVVVHISVSELSKSLNKLHFDYICISTTETNTEFAQQQQYQKWKTKRTSENNICLPIRDKSSWFMLFECCINVEYVSLNLPIQFH